MISTQDVALAARVGMSLQGDLKFYKILMTHMGHISQIIAGMEPYRIPRALECCVESATPTEEGVAGEVSGRSGTRYFVKIDLGARFRHMCECPDADYRGSRRPCKHVVALALFHWDEYVRYHLQELDVS